MRKKKKKKRKQFKEQRLLEISVVLNLKIEEDLKNTNTLKK